MYSLRSLECNQRKCSSDEVLILTAHLGILVIANQAIIPSFRDRASSYLDYQLVLFTDPSRKGTACVERVLPEYGVTSKTTQYCNFCQCH